jgi:RimJ/RimL family protein N-acetyltransferase
MGSGAFFTFTLLDRTSQHTVGFAVLRPEIFAFDGILRAESEIALARTFYHYGYAYETMSGLFNWSFDAIKYPNGKVLDEIRAACVLTNNRSLRLLAKLAAVGMKDLGEQEVFVRSLHPGHDLITDHRPHVSGHVFAITRDDHRACRT